MTGAQISQRLDSSSGTRKSGSRRSRPSGTIDSSDAPPEISSKSESANIDLETLSVGQVIEGMKKERHHKTHQKMQKIDLESNAGFEKALAASGAVLAEIGQ